MDDVISRKAAIDAVYKCDDIFVGDMPVMVVKADAYEALAQLPSAQPETHEERTKTHSCDLISRQAAIDAILAVTGNSSVRELYEHVQEHGLSDMWSGGVNAAIDIIIALPSAQPEPCVDTIDALDESIKHFDDMAEECRRNANIEQNDYMDMRDDAAEYRQLSIWLNELKWLRERFQSQPDLSEYSDKLWKRAYERGKAEAQQGWIPFKTRPLTEEEKEGNPDWDRIFDCILPEDGQAILISVNLRGHESVQYDEFYTDDGSYLDSGYEIGDEAVAWMPLPEPYAERRTDG